MWGCVCLNSCVLGGRVRDKVGGCARVVGLVVRGWKCQPRCCGILLGPRETNLSQVGVCVSCVNVRDGGAHAVPKLDLGASCQEHTYSHPCAEPLRAPRAGGHASEYIEHTLPTTTFVTIPNQPKNKTSRPQQIEGRPNNALAHNHIGTLLSSLCPAGPQTHTPAVPLRHMCDCTS